MAKPSMWGMTLIELVMVLAIAAILLGITYPLYVEQTTRARRAEAMAALQQIALAQERYYAVHQQYASELGVLTLDTAVQTGLSPRGYYQLSIATSDEQQTFIANATAASVQTQDVACQQFWLNQLGQRGAIDQAGVANLSCW